MPRSHRRGTPRRCGTQGCSQPIGEGRRRRRTTPDGRSREVRPRPIAPFAKARSPAPPTARDPTAAAAYPETLRQRSGLRGLRSRTPRPVWSHSRGPFEHDCCGAVRAQGSPEPTFREPPSSHPAAHHQSRRGHRLFPMGNASDADLGNRPDSVESYPDPDLASMREQLERSSRRPNHESFEINACRASGTCSVLANRDRERIRNFPRRLIVDTSSQYDGSTQDKSDTSHSAHSTNRLPLRLSAGGGEPNAYDRFPRPGPSPNLRNIQTAALDLFRLWPLRTRMTFLRPRSRRRTLS